MADSVWRIERLPNPKSNPIDPSSSCPAKSVIPTLHVASTTATTGVGSSRSEKRLAVDAAAKYTYPPYRSSGLRTVSHVAKEKTKLLNRLRRIRGQVEAIERAVEGDQECARVLQQATACRGALEGFIAEVIEDHIREHLVDPTAPKDDMRVQAAEELIDIVKAYLR
jgi:DNA-binding FrmR family transcriptional regulator